MAQANPKHIAEIIPFPREAVHRTWAPKRLGQKLNGKRTLFETVQSELVMMAHFADHMAGQAQQLSRAANHMWERADDTHRKLLGFGVEEAANGHTRMHGPAVEGGGQ